MNNTPLKTPAGSQPGNKMRPWAHRPGGVPGLIPTFQTGAGRPEEASQQSPERAQPCPECHSSPDHTPGADGGLRNNVARSSALGGFCASSKAALLAGRKPKAIGQMISDFWIHSFFLLRRARPNSPEPHPGLQNSSECGQWRWG